MSLQVRKGLGGSRQGLRTIMRRGLNLGMIGGREIGLSCPWRDLWGFQCWWGRGPG